MPAPSKPRYPIPWIATYLLVGLVLVVGAISMAWFTGGAQDEYERANPDFELLERIARSDTSRTGDFTKLNSGDWTALCLVGAGGDVVAALREGGVPKPWAATISQAFEAEPPALHETEFTLAYVDAAGTAKLLRHPHGFAFARAGVAKCTTPEKPTLMLPVGMAL